MHASSDESWQHATPSEMLKLIGLVIYMDNVKIPQLKLHWNVESIYGGLIAPRIMQRRRFMALLEMMRVADLDHASQQ